MVSHTLHILPPLYAPSLRRGRGLGGAPQELFERAALAFERLADLAQRSALLFDGLPQRGALLFERVAQLVNLCVAPPSGLLHLGQAPHNTGQAAGAHEELHPRYHHAGLVNPARAIGGRKAATASRANWTSSGSIGVLLIVFNGVPQRYLATAPRSALAPAA